MRTVGFYSTSTIGLKEIGIILAAQDKCLGPEDAGYRILDSVWRYLGYPESYYRERSGTVKEWWDGTKSCNN